MRISDWSSDVCSSDLAGSPSPFRAPAFAGTLPPSPAGRGKGGSALSLTADDGAAVRMQHLPRHVAGIVAGEEQEGGRDLVGLAGAAHRGVLAEMRELFLIRPARRIERGPDRPRRDRVDEIGRAHV